MSRNKMANPPTNPAEVEALLSSLATDPLKFIALCWPHMRLYDKQREVLLSVRDNVETFVPAANATGKTLIAAAIAIWWFASRTPARVITSSSSETQLKSILWSQIKHLIRTSAFPLPFRVTHLLVQKLTQPESSETEPQDYIIGHVTNEVENFQGHHLPGDRPRVLVIFDEASGVPDEFFEAADSWAHRKLVIGNPLSVLNFFYRLSKAGDAPDPAGTAKLLRKVIHIDGRDTPNVQAGIQWAKAGQPGRPPVIIHGLLAYDDYLRREQEWDEVQKTTRLYGRFYEGEQALMFPAGWLDSAMSKGRWKELEGQERMAEAMGVDVAGGRDETCWTIVDRQGVIEQIVKKTPNTMEIAGITLRLMEEYDLPGALVAMDAGGGGKQIFDRLLEQEVEVELVWFGETATSQQAYKNRRAEMYATLRDLINPDRGADVFALPPTAYELRRELLALPLQYDSEGRLQLPPKTEIRALLGRSPDLSDSLALAVWALGLEDDEVIPEGTLLDATPSDFEWNESEYREQLKKGLVDPYIADLIDMQDNRHKWDPTWDEPDSPRW